MINLQAKLEGEYRLVITRGDGSVEDTGWFPNVILNQGLDRLGDSAGIAIMRYAQVGSGNIAPAITQTSLQTYVAGGLSSPDSQASAFTNEGSPLYRTTLTYTFVFTQGSVLGNITEVGCGWGSSGATLFSRALILDGGGSPTSITLVAIDQLTVYYRLRIAPVITDTTGSVTLNSIVYNYTMRVAQVGSFANIQFLLNSSNNFSTVSSSGFTGYPAGSVLGSITSAGPSGSPAASGTASSSTYSPGTYYRDATFTFNTAQGNAAGGIQCIRFTWPQSYSVINFQTRFDTPIPKDNTKVLTLVLRYSWARV